jgi:putative ABC transport system ATP-binding protein
MTALLSLLGVTRDFGDGPARVHALRHADLEVEPGELVAIMGPSGSGKSTLLMIAGGLDAPSDGTVLVEGTDLGSLDADGLAVVRRTKVGYVFQELNLLAGLTAAENVAAPLELDGVRAGVANAEAIARLGEVGLAERSAAFPDDLSGGERQRVAIARALVGDRRLVLADEPTGSLDSETGATITALLRSLCDEGAAVVVATHDPGVAGAADRTLRIRDGVLGHDQPAPVTSAR